MHVQYCYILMLIFGLASVLMHDWYCLKLTSTRTRIEAICSARVSESGATDTTIACAYQWLILTLGMTGVSNKVELDIL